MNDINWIDIDDIVSSLPKEAINVSFDIDDTIFSTFYLFMKIRKKYNLAKNDKTENQSFWRDLNCSVEEYDAIVKSKTKKLIKIHQDRGDNIYFITGRVGTSEERLSCCLKNIFGNKGLHDVIFTSHISYETTYDKTPFIRKHNISIHYGDSDSDILSAMEAKIRGIRILREDIADYATIPTPGKFGEEVLKDSK